MFSLPSGSTHYREDLQSEVDSAVSSALSVAHDPDTEDHFFSFTTDGIVQELQSTCPQLYTLFQQLTKTQRNVVNDTGVLPLPELKGVMSLCTTDLLRQKECNFCWLQC